MAQIWNKHMRDERQQLIRSLFDEYIEMYASRDDRLTARFSENFSGYTGGGDFLVKDMDEWVRITRQDFSQVTGRIHIEMQDISLQDISDDVVIATAFFKIHLPIQDRILSRETARLTLVFRRETDDWKIAHSGISIPYHLVQDGEVYPLNGLKERNRELESLVQEHARELYEAQRMAQIGSWRLDLATNQVKWTEELCRMYGADPTQPPPPYAEHMKFFTPASWERLSFAMAHTKETEIPYELELEMVKKDGGNGWMWVRGETVKDLAGNITALRGTSQDITERKIADESLRRSYEALRSIQKTTLDGFWSVNNQCNFLDVNPAYCKMSGYTREELLGMRIMDVEADEGPDKTQTRLNRLFESGYDQFESRHRRKDGTTWHVEVSTTYSKDAGGQIFAFIRDVTERKSHEKHLQQIAYHDTLTNLPNRVLLADHLNLAMAQSRRHGKPLAVVYVDLDNFKPINDRHGHDVGDQVLVKLASRMKQALREGDTLARLGGDEFVAVLLDVSDIKACEPMINRLLAAACQPTQIGEFRFEVSASVGVTIYPQVDDMDADQLLRQADNAMYQAKQAGKNRYYLFDAEQDRSVRSHREGIERIRQALAREEFVLHYQPKVDLVTGEVFSAEALIRWQHPEKGLLSPAAFLPHLDGSDIETAVGEWVIDTALKQLETWIAAGQTEVISVNISANHLLNTGFLTQLALALNRYPKVPPDSLVIEILESAAISDMSQAVNVLTRCRELGVRISLDDFGTGYSSLTYLRRLPVNILKIDQSFVRDMLTDPSDMGIVISVIQLAKTFNLKVIAEGVETLEHGAMLVQLGCPQMQGYGIAHPMPADQMSDWISQWRDRKLWRLTSS